MKRELPLLITAVIGLFMILSFFVPHHLVSVPADYLQQCAVIVVAFGYVLGGANALRVNLAGIAPRQPDWIYKIVLVAALLATVVIGLFEGRRWQEPGTVSMFFYNQLYSPMQATMFALLAFFIASAAFRAFRIRTVEAGLLAAALTFVSAMVFRRPSTMRAIELIRGTYAIAPLLIWAALRFRIVRSGSSRP